MTFRRTNSGLSNLYQFVGADVVVFVEGGESINRDRVNNGEYKSFSSDIRFWQAIFNAYMPDVNFQFRSVGSKNTVKSIALDIEKGKVNNVVAAMDRDFDHINGRLIVSNNVIYTKGYSWENDVWTKEVILETFCSLSGLCRNDTQHVRGCINKSIIIFSKCIRRAVRIDAILSQFDDSLFDRKKPRRYLLQKGAQIPIVDMQQIKNSLKEARSRNRRPIINKSNFVINEVADCFGHLLAEYLYKLLASLIEKKKLPSVPKEYASGMMVEKFMQAFNSNSLHELKNHYDAEFSKISISNQIA